MCWCLGSLGDLGSLRELGSLVTSRNPKYSLMLWLAPTGLWNNDFIKNLLNRKWVNQNTYLFDIKYQMIRCIEHEKYPNCVRLRTVGTVVSDMGRLRMVKNINFLRHHKNIFDTLKTSDFSFFKRSTFLAVFWVSGGKIEIPIQVLWYI